MRKKNCTPNFYCAIYLQNFLKEYHNQYLINRIESKLLEILFWKNFRTIRKNSLFRELSITIEKGMRMREEKKIMEFFLFFFLYKYTYMEIFHRTFFPRIKRVWTEGSTSDGTIEIPLTRIPLPSYDSPSLSLLPSLGSGGRPTSLRRPHRYYLWLLPMAKAIDC